MANLERLSAEVVSSILYTYAKERRGSNTFISSLAERLEQETPQQLQPDLVAQIIVTLNLLGRKDTREFKAFSRHAKQSVDAVLSPEARAVMRQALI